MLLVIDLWIIILTIVYLGKNKIKYTVSSRQTDKLINEYEKKRNAFNNAVSDHDMYVYLRSYDCRQSQEWDKIKSYIYDKYVDNGPLKDIIPAYDTVSTEPIIILLYMSEHGKLPPMYDIDIPTRLVYNGNKEHKMDLLCTEVVNNLKKNNIQCKLYRALDKRMVNNVTYIWDSSIISYEQYTIQKVFE